jgi:hypothetical protein
MLTIGKKLYFLLNLARFIPSKTISTVMTQHAAIVKNSWLFVVQIVARAAYAVYAVQKP